MDEKNKAKLEQVQDFIAKNGRAYYAKYRHYEEPTFGVVLDDILPLAKKKKMTALDVGCAYGTFLAFLVEVGKSVDAHGIDHLPNILPAEVKKKYGITLHLLDIMKDLKKFKAKKFDVINVSSVFSHLHYNPTLILKELAKRLKAKGALYLSHMAGEKYPNDLYPTLADMPKKPGDPLPAKEKIEAFSKKILNATHFFTLDEIAEMADAAGLKIAKVLQGNANVNNVKLVKKGK